jgi:hypothetical protein
MRIGCGFASQVNERVLTCETEEFAVSTHEFYDASFRLTTNHTPRRPFEFETARISTVTALRCDVCMRERKNLCCH